MDTSRVQVWFYSFWPLVRRSTQCLCCINVVSFDVCLCAIFLCAMCVSFDVRQNTSLSFWCRLSWFVWSGDGVSCPRSSKAFQRCLRGDGEGGHGRQRHERPKAGGVGGGVWCEVMMMMMTTMTATHFCSACVRGVIVPSALRMIRHLVENLWFNDGPCIFAGSHI